MLIFIEKMVVMFLAASSILRKHLTMWTTGCYFVNYLILLIMLGSTVPSDYLATGIVTRVFLSNGMIVNHRCLVFRTE
jgi:hypothetical protein